MSADEPDDGRTDNERVVASLADLVREPDEAALAVIMEQVAETAQARHTEAVQRFNDDMQALREQVRSKYLPRGECDGLPLDKPSR